MNKKKISIILGIVCCILTFGIALQIKTIQDTLKTTDATLVENELRDEVLKWKEKYDNCYSDLEKSEKELENQRQNATQNDTDLNEKEKQLNSINKYLGLTDVNGEGLVITFRDNQTVTKATAKQAIENYMIHNMDIVRVINELKNAGAEAISINDQRIVQTSSIMCAGNVVQINGEKVGAPFIIKAISKSDVLYDALARPGGIIEELKALEIVADVKKQNNISILKHDGVMNLKYIK